VLQPVNSKCAHKFAHHSPLHAPGKASDANGLGITRRRRARVRHAGKPIESGLMFVTASRSSRCPRRLPGDEGR